MTERIPKKKTWKREIAAAIMVAFWYIVIWKENVELVKVLVYPVFTFTAFAYGLDWYGRTDRVQWRGSSEPPNGRGS